MSERMRLIGVKASYVWIGDGGKGACAPMQPPIPSHTFLPWQSGGSGAAAAASSPNQSLNAHPVLTHLYSSRATTDASAASLFTCVCGAPAVGHQQEGESAARPGQD